MGMQRASLLGAWWGSLIRSRFGVPRPERRCSRSPWADGRGVAVLAASPDAMRVIPHLRISDADVEEALGVFAEVLSAVPA